MIATTCRMKSCRRDPINAISVEILPTLDDSPLCLKVIYICPDSSRRGYRHSSVLASCPCRPRRAKGVVLHTSTPLTSTLSVFGDAHLTVRYCQVVCNVSGYVHPSREGANHHPQSQDTGRPRTYESATFTSPRKKHDRIISRAANQFHPARSQICCTISCCVVASCIRTFLLPTTASGPPPITYSNPPERVIERLSC